MTQILRELLDKAPFGFVCHMARSDNYINHTDYIFKEANKEFEKMTGLKIKNITDMSVSEVECGIHGHIINWNDLYGKLDKKDDKYEFTIHIDKQKYKISVFSPEQGYFTTIFQDITDYDVAEEATQTKPVVDYLSENVSIMFNSTQDAMFLVQVKDGEFKYIKSNTSHQKLTGISLEYIKNKTPVELAGVKIGRIIESNYQMCVNEGKTVSYEEEIDLPIGRTVWLTSLTPIFENGEIKYIIGSSKDILKQKTLEEERKVLYERLKAMFYGHSAVMILIEPYSGRIIDVNPAALSFYGYTKNELVNMYIQDINVLPKEEVTRRRMLVLKEKQRYFHHPHRLKNGEIRQVDVYSCPIEYNNQKVLFSIIIDVSDEERYKEELYKERELFKTTILSIGDGLVTTDCNGIITSMNKIAEELTGFGVEAVGKEFSEVFKLKDDITGKDSENPISKVLQTGRIIGLANHTSLINKKGKRIPIADSAAPIINANGEVFGVVMVFRDVTNEKDQQAKITYLSYHDTLTKLYNRRFAEEQLRLICMENKPDFSIIMGDLNGLKLINDVFGHEEGDNRLIKAANVIKASCQPHDIVARWGGDEFLIIVCKDTGTRAEKIIEKIKEECSKECSYQEQVSISLGYAVKSNVSGSISNLIKEAEEAMYRCKLLEGGSYRNNIINTMLTTLFEKSVETEEHAERLKKYSLALCKKFNLSAKETDEMGLFAMLHDMGKVVIDDGILNKPGPLTSDEWREMQKHTEVGYRIAQNTPELASVAEYILFHHERWDGKGYPAGLKGNDIPILCRILAVVDAFDAMTNDRSYRKAMPADKALAELVKNSGTQFDPQVVDAFLEII